jgi:hypothetical protein
MADKNVYPTTIKFLPLFFAFSSSPRVFVVLPFLFPVTNDYFHCRMRGDRLPFPL